MNITEYCADCGGELLKASERFACQLCDEYRKPNPTRCYRCVWHHKIQAHGADPPADFAEVGRSISEAVAPRRHLSAVSGPRADAHGPTPNKTGRSG